MFRFSIRELILATMVVLLFLGWASDRSFLRKSAIAWQQVIRSEGFEVRGDGNYFEIDNGSHTCIIHRGKMYRYPQDFPIEP